MLRVAFPTNQNISYISPVESTFENSNYLTILDLKGQNILDVQIIKNPHPHSKEEIINECKEKHFGVLILPQEEDLPIKELKQNGVSVFLSKNNKTILNAYSDFIQDKLERVQ